MLAGEHPPPLEKGIIIEDEVPLHARYRKLDKGFNDCICYKVKDYLTALEGRVRNLHLDFHESEGFQGLRLLSNKSWPLRPLRRKASKDVATNSTLSTKH